MLTQPPPAPTRVRRLRPATRPSAPGALPARRHLRHRLLAVAAGLLVALMTVALRLSGILDGAWAVVTAVVLVLAVPTSRLMSRRVLLAAGLAAGLVPALWWWTLPLGPLGRAGTLLTLIAGGLTTAVLWAGPRQAPVRLRSAWPRWNRLDGIVAAASAGAAYVAAPWLSVRSGAHALGSLIGGWDNSAHLDMVLMLRHHGVVTAAAGGAPPGETWKFVEYPQGFHAMVATTVELLGSPTVGTPAQEVLAYSHVQGLLIIALAAVLTAALVALPAARRHPMRALLLSALVVAAFVIGPGGRAFSGGFPNFVLAAAATAVALLLVLSMPRVLMPLQLAALGGLVVLVAHSWALMLAVMAPVLMLLVVPLRRGTPASIRPWTAVWRAPRSRVVASLVVLVAVVVGLIQMLRTVLVLNASDVLVIPGGFVVPEAGLLVAVVAGAFAVTLWPVTRGPHRLVWTALVPVVGTVAAAGIGVVQLRGGGELSYYFWKFVLGLVLVCVVVLATGLLWALPTARPTVHRTDEATRRRRPGARHVLGALSVLAGLVAVTQVFGLLPRPPASEARAPGVAAAAELLRAADVATGERGAPVPDVRVTYVTTSDTVHPLAAQQWFLALTNRWTVEANTDAGALLDDNGLPLPTADAVAALLAADDDSLIVMPPQDVVIIAPSLTNPSASDRIRSAF